MTRKFDSTHLLACLALALIPATAGAELRESQTIGDTPPQAGARWGAAMTAGDFDDDGFTDLVIAAPEWNYLTNHDAGRLRVYPAGPGGFRVPTLDEHFTQSNGNLGIALAAVDFEGHGHPTWLAVGVPGASPGNTESGAIYLYEYDGDWSYRTFFSPGFAAVYGGNGAYDHFGSVLAVGDFDGDGYQDLAASALDKRITLSGTHYNDAGTVHIFYGSASGPSTAGNQWFHGGMFGEEQSRAGFGGALAAGDFDGDGYDDLAIGVPYQVAYIDSGFRVNSGQVRIVFGSTSGLVTSGSQRLRDSDFGNAIETGDTFGAALAAGDFDLSLFCISFPCYVDLAIGVPGENDEAGRVAIGYGSSTGIDPTDRQNFYQHHVSAASSAEAGDRFGAVLQVGGIDANIGADLLIGAPAETWNTVTQQGIAHVLYGGSSGLGSYASETLVMLPTDSSTPGAPGDDFGSAFAVGNFDGSGPRDVAVGVPGRLRSGLADAGMVRIYGEGIFGDGFESGTTSAWSAKTP